MGGASSAHPRGDPRPPGTPAGVPRPPRRPGGPRAAPLPPAPWALISSFRSWSSGAAPGSATTSAPPPRPPAARGSRPTAAPPRAPPPVRFRSSPAPSEPCASPFGAALASWETRRPSVPLPPAPARLGVGSVELGDGVAGLRRFQALPLSPLGLRGPGECHPGCRLPPFTQPRNKGNKEQSPASEMASASWGVGSGRRHLEVGQGQDRREIIGVFPLVWGHLLEDNSGWGRPGVGGC